MQCPSKLILPVTTDQANTVVVSNSNSNSNTQTSNSSTSQLTLPFNFLQHLYQYFQHHYLEMGNWWGSSNNSSSITQPQIFGKLPDPYPISKIAPVLLIYPNSGKDYCLTIDSSYSFADAVELLRSKACLDGAKRFVVITHGFQSNKDTAWLHELKEAILQCDTRKQTVAILGWGNGADIGLLRYNQAASNSLETGRWLGGFLGALREAIPDLATYGIGHSLGAHLMGVAGRTSKALDRISGLDPAGVGFQDQNIDKRLNRLDAQLVDVMHTDGRDVPYFGTLVPLGLIDFYPNYGWNQPTKDRSRAAKPDLELDEKHHKIVQPSPYGGYISESHGRAIDYFTFSVRNNRAFRTTLHLDGEPDVEIAIHRVVSTTANRDSDDEIVVEMGYYCDVFIDQQIKRREEVTQCLKAGPRSDEYTRYDPFAGCYYVHTNGTAPWC